MKCADLPVKEFKAKKFPAHIDNTKRKEWLTTGIESWMHSNFNANSDQKIEKDIKGWTKNNLKSLGDFYDDISPESDFARQASFAKLTSHAFADAVNINASTFLCIGSILKNDLNEYYMCIQPLCDSIRLSYNVAKKFIFIKLSKKEFDITEENKKGFNIIVNDGGNDIYLKANEDTSTLDVFSFTASSGNDKAIIKIGETIQGNNNNDVIVNFTFLAQLKKSPSQRIAMRFLHKITRVGFDEFEWLRRHGSEDQ